MQLNVRVGFFGGPASFADGGIQGVTFTGGVLEQSDGMGNSLITDDTLSLIVGQIDWAANGSLDTISLFNVTDPTAPLGTPFSTMTLDVDQTTFDTFSIADGQTSGFDEIRFGMTLEDVLPVGAVGDVNMDGMVDLLDVTPFVNILTGG